jgi:hypothetical protein
MATVRNRSQQVADPRRESDTSPPATRQEALTLLLTELLPELNEAVADDQQRLAELHAQGADTSPDLKLRNEWREAFARAQRIEQHLRRVEQRNDKLATLGVRLSERAPAFGRYVDTVAAIRLRPRIARPIRRPRAHRPRPSKRARSPGGDDPPDEADRPGAELSRAARGRLGMVRGRR